MRGSNKFRASVTSGVLMSLFLHSKVADSRTARASESVMVCVKQKVCQCGQPCDWQDRGAFFIDSILYVYDFEADRRRNSTHAVAEKITTGKLVSNALSK